MEDIKNVTALEEQTIKRISNRIIPFLIILFIMAFLDRTNIGFAALHMNDALGITQTIFGLGADVIFPYEQPLKHGAGFIVLSGNFFDSAIMKMSVVGEAFKKTYLSDPSSENSFEARAIVFEGPEDYHARINDPALDIDEHCILVIRGAGTVGYPGSAEVVNMAPPAELIKKGIDSLPCLGDGRQSGTSASPSILNMSPEAAVGGGIALLKTNDRLRIDLNKRSVNVLISEEELEQRRREWKPTVSASQTPWQEMYRNMVGQLSTGGCLEPATLYMRVVNQDNLPRHSH